jgi:hypothetical protein
MIKEKLSRLALLAVAPTGLLLGAASVAHAQYGPYTFDTSSSFYSQSVNHDGNNFDNNLNPSQYPYVALDYGGAGSTTANSTETWENTYDATGNGGGAVQLSTTFNEPANGAGGSAFVVQLESNPSNPGATDATLYATNVSFDVLVDPSSTPDAYGGYGYFQVATVEPNYSQDGNSFAEELGNPTYSSPSTGTWQHISIPLNPADPFFAVVFQDYQDAGRATVGPVTYDIDDLTLTPVPEPASLGMLGLTVPALLRRRRAAAGR